MSFQSMSFCYDVDEENSCSQPGTCVAFVGAPTSGRVFSKYSVSSPVSKLYMSAEWCVCGCPSLSVGASLRGPVMEGHPVQCESCLMP